MIRLALFLENYFLNISKSHTSSICDTNIRIFKFIVSFKAMCLFFGCNCSYFSNNHSSVQHFSVVTLRYHSYLIACDFASQLIISRYVFKIKHPNIIILLSHLVHFILIFWFHCNFLLETYFSCKLVEKYIKISCNKIY